MTLQQSIPLPPIITVADFSFNALLIAAIDRSQYDAKDPERIIVLYLAGNIEHEFEGDRADEFNKWYLSLYGQTSPLV
jgi:hypothetical protein